ncbi:MAG TPA: translesion error-prone DNA polymerase V autoproteolytic subunit [Nitrosomonas sp.]|nr:translesion error-prone DNA polymerase V autoproteolytic subunit [Nitrosomonas sp.]HQX13434.1 translesion error-prone DNA polymerase V autoproteolytic subunit [Nitrosomonas sp.]HRB31888.1 translesion error-prone DNA polymerase V autoproteolytic subunit [Nitrosomonas sp.]HRB44721.1 translesion error-prone DNA polymerase V autoproteolytic subunit [Nitrosomonas sp.]HRB76822.1 translesion error-prone DNA polymerase V autoproteolytic subunit [Nitrosomonas sp.]
MSKRGGKRENAGRPAGQGRYGEPTKSIRVPLSQETTVRSFLDAFEKRKAINDGDVSNVEEMLIPRISEEPIRLPLYSTKVAAGLPSPADDHVENTLDISEFMIDRKDSTFFITIKGESMIDVGLMPGDKVVVDRSKTPVIGDIVLAVVDREFTIKIYDLGANKMPRLVPANSSGTYRPIYIRPDMQFEIFGVVTGSFRRFK